MRATAKRLGPALPGALPAPPQAATISGLVITMSSAPDASMIERVRKFARQLEHLILIVNGAPLGVLKDLEKRFPPEAAVTLLHSPTRIGHAQALNLGFGTALASGYRWVLILDDDTDADDNLAAGLLEYRAKQRNNPRIGIVGANFIFRGSATAAPVCPAGECISVQASGSLISADLWLKLGGFNANLYAYGVELEFCLQARRAGYLTVVTDVPFMTHAAGNPSAHRFLWRTINTFNYPPERLFLIFRNTAALAREYYHDAPAWFSTEARFLLRTILCINLYENRKRAKLAAAIRGTLSGLRLYRDLVKRP